MKWLLLLLCCVALYLAYTVAEEAIHHSDIVSAKLSKQLQRAYEGY